MKVEFFHDVICSFCFPMSYRMREVKELLPEIEITHRSFALGWEASDFEAMFGSRSAVKPEVMNHWEHANQNDTLHRFNIEGMKAKDFDFPTSKKALIAAKAAGIIGNQDTYWDIFDALQDGLFVRNLNIEETEVIESIIKETDIDFNQWKHAFESDETLKAVEADLALAKSYGLNGVPALIINEKYLINGAQSKQTIISTLKKILEEEKQAPKIISFNDDESASCHVEDGKWHCD